MKTSACVNSIYYGYIEDLLHWSPVGAIAFFTIKFNLGILNKYVKQLNISLSSSGAGGFIGKHPSFSYRLAKPSKPIFFPKVAKSEAN